MDFNSSFNDDSWLYSSNNNNNNNGNGNGNSGFSNETLQEPVPFEDFKFTFNTSFNDLQPSSTLIDPFLQEPFNFLTPATNTVLDENDQKAFSSFLDAFFMDPEMQFPPQPTQENTSDFYNNYEEEKQQPQKEREEEEEHRRSSILQSLDEQKMLHQRLNLLASLPANKIKSSNDQSRSPSFNNTTSSVTSLSEDDNSTTPQTIYLRQSNSIASPYTITPTTNTASASAHHQMTRKRSSSSAQLYSNYEKENTKKPIKKSKSTKELLTEEEKRANHIASEQKRRSTIRTGFKELTDLIPTLKNINNSKSTVLFKAVDFIRYLEKRNKGLREKVGSLELRAEVEGRMTQTTAANSIIPGVVNNKHDVDKEKELISSLPFSAELPPLTPNTVSSTTSTSSSIATLASTTSTASKFKPVEASNSSNSITKKVPVVTTNTSLPYLTQSKKPTTLSPHYTLSNGNPISKHNSLPKRRRSSSSSGSSNHYGNQNLQGLPANARNALLAHKTQQKQLLILQEQLQMHQRLIAQQQEMKERSLSGSSSSNMKNKLPPILGQYDTSSKSSRHNGKSSLLKELEDKAISAP